jgi:hypothetical protein
MKIKLHHSWSRYWMEMSGQLHALVALPPYPLYRRLDSPQTLSGLYGEQNISYLCWKSNLGRPVHIVVAILTEQSRFLLCERTPIKFILTAVCMKLQV